MIQSGTNGNVYRFINSNNQQLAVKESLGFRSIDFIYSLRELDTMIKLKGCENILELKEYTFIHPMIKSKSKEVIDSVFLIFDLADCDLLDMIDSVPENKLDDYYRQLIEGLTFIHSRGIIHRDIKPENILFFRSSDRLKYCDFGLSKRFVSGKKNTLTVCTPCYKAPEIFFEDTGYGFGIDIFSLGLVFCEMKFKRLYLQDTKTMFATLKQFIKKSKDDFTINQLKERFPDSRILANKMQRKQLELVKRVNIFKIQDQHTEMIQSMLRFIPEKRIKLNELRIKLGMNEIELKEVPSQRINRIESSEDQELVNSIRMKLKSKEYFSNSILEESIDLFSRFYPKILNERKIDVFFSCLYISIKNENYISNHIPRFEELLRDYGVSIPIDHSYFENLERRIIMEIIDQDGLFH
jgi:serine/threonine protein kinase